MKSKVLVLAAVLASVSAAPGVEFFTAEISGKKATVARVNVKTERLQLFLRTADGEPLKTFDRLVKMLAPTQRRLVFACNAGMYHADYTPVGLFAEGGKQVAPLNLGDA